MTTIQITQLPLRLDLTRLARTRLARPRLAWRSALVVVAAVGLAACETGSGALTGATPQTSLASNAQPMPPPPPVPLTKVSIAPVIGAPDAVGRTLSQDMAGNLSKHKSTVVAAGEKSDYTLRGYIVAAKDKANTKVSYIWDVTDTAGKRLNRITGEEVVSGQSPKDPWSAVSPQIIAAIAQKSANSFGAWLPSAGGTAPIPMAAAPGGQPAAVQTASVGGAAAAGVGAAGAAAAAAPRQQPAATQTSVPATGGNLAAIVPSISGAPGDGATSLSKALQGELSKSGVAISGQQNPAAYRVEGVVKMTPGQAGRQGIQIDWNVKDPQGKKLGTVSQKNEIAEGSLDGAWGQTADAAAAAAAQGILKLLPR